MRYKCSLLLLLFFSFSILQAEIDPSAMESLPVLYQGRFRPLKAYTALSYYAFSHKQKLPKSLPFKSPEELLLNLHFKGVEPFLDSPLFALELASFKEHLGVDLKRNLFSYNELKQALQKRPDPEGDLVKRLELFALFEKNVENQQLTQFAQALKNQGLTSSEIAAAIEEASPLKARLLNSGPTFQMLPLKIPKGSWVSISALALQDFNAQTGEFQPIANFTLYPDLLFKEIQQAYLKQDLTSFAHYLDQGYSLIENSFYQKGIKKPLTYPSKQRLQAEVFYYSFPLLETTLFLYGLTILLFLAAYYFQTSNFRAIAVCSIALAFIAHTMLLGLRCYILQRPPVSNMFETIIYVPWITVLGSFFFSKVFNNPFIMIGSCIVAVLLLVIVYISRINSSLENVQAVLDSQYWLIIHVLMIVGSYGLFLFAGLLGHLSLAAYALHQHTRHWIKQIESLTLQTLYLGTALLIPGTLLGGAWAAESWGRFWDWDPKESWAFISSCVYIFWIHLYRFHHISGFGLALGAIVGMQSIIFTWYGVNYILGTGLHSYGFGSGGNFYYFLFVAAEVLFITFATFSWKKRLMHASH